MTALLAIVATVAEAAIASAHGADQTAVLARAGESPLGPADASVGTIVWPAGNPAGPVAPSSLAARPGPLWLPVHQDWVELVEQAIGAGVPVTGCIPADAIGAGLAEAMSIGLTDVLIGVAPFSGQKLLDVCPIVELARWAQHCRDTGLRFGFLGGLEPPDVPRLKALGAQVLGFDTALRDGADCLQPSQISALAALMNDGSAEDDRVRPHPADRTGMPAVPDRITVRDWVVAMSIGAYERERGRAQRVRFTVEASVRPGPGSGLADTLSYDLITDGIARVAADHVDLVEEVAERLAALVLAHPRVLDIDIAVDKLDVGPGSVGCRILRRRPGPQT